MTLTQDPVIWNGREEEPLQSWSWSQASRLLDAAVVWFLSCIVLWVAILAALQYWFAPHLTNHTRAGLAALIAVPAAVCVALLMHARRYERIALYPDRIDLRRGGLVEEILYSDVIGLVGRGGINLDGGEMLVWKKLFVLTEDRRRCLEIHHEVNAGLYHYLREHCSKSWGIPFRGTLESPKSDRRTNSDFAMAVSLGQLGRFYRLQVTKTATIGLAVASISLAGLVAVWVFAGINSDTSKGIGWLIVGVVAGALVLSDALRNATVMLRIQRAARGLPSL